MLLRLKNVWGSTEMGWRGLWAVILDWKVCFWRDSWWLPACFTHKSIVLCLAVASLKGSAVPAVGDQELLPVASSVSSVKPPVTVSFSYTVFSSEGLLALRFVVICDNYMFLYLYFVSTLATAKSFDLWIPGQKDMYTSHPPNIILEAHSCWPAAYLVRKMIKDYVLWVSVLVIHPIAKMRIGQNILFPRIASESKTYLNKKWEKVLLEHRRWNLFGVPETHHTYVTSSHRHGRWKERVTQCWSVPESVPRYILKMR